jgi:hypothetical protein
MASTFHDRLGQAARALQAGLPWAMPRARRTGPFESVLAINPRPLINPDARMVVLFSPKAACSNVAIWFFHHLGHGATARDYSRWPHRYRLKVYYPSELYRRACTLDLTGFKVIRIIRDPFERAASSFRHAVRTGLANDDIRDKLGRDATQGFSFNQYLDYLERLDLRSCDPHFRVQRHPLEDVLGVDDLINVSKDDLFARLGAIEAELGLKPPGRAMTEWIDDLRSSHNRPNRVLPATPDLADLPLTREQARKGPWPAPPALLTAPARERLARLYAIDIRSYLQGAGL